MMMSRKQMKDMDSDMMKDKDFQQSEELAYPHFEGNGPKAKKLYKMAKQRRKK